MSAKKKSSAAESGRTFTFNTGVGKEVIGRHSNSSLVFSLYREILKIEAANQTATFGVLYKAMKQNPEFKIDEKKFRNEIKLAVTDKLICCSKSVYRIDKFRRCGKSDLYCFNCYKSGEELRKCNNCWRVYHLKCFNYCDVRGKCFFCKSYPQEPIRQKLLTKKDVNDLLLILHNKLKKEHSTVVDASNYVNENDSLVELVANFVYMYDSTFNEIEEKIRNEFYESVMQYVFHCKQIIFNINVLYGIDSDLAEKAKEMHQFLLSEEHIIHNCIDCYVNLSNKAEDDKGEWFLLPCNPPHQVCFVQVVGYPHYPAKVIEAEEDDTFVRFFDENRETADTSNTFILPMLPKNTEMTDELKKAVEEYEMYVQASKDHQELQSSQEQF